MTSGLVGLRLPLFSALFYFTGLLICVLPYMTLGWPAFCQPDVEKGIKIYKDLALGLHSQGAAFSHTLKHCQLTIALQSGRAAQQSCPQMHVLVTCPSNCK